MTFLNQTMNEILGQFRPGDVPFVYGTDAVDTRMVAQHERAHQRLTGASSYGRYLAALAIAAREEDQLEQLQASLQTAIRQCWVVQEAYATAVQLLHVARRWGHASERETRMSLPPSYSAALLVLPDIAETVRTTISEYGSYGRPLTTAEARSTVSSALDACYFVLARAAMSVPIACFFHGTQAGGLARLNAALRWDSPDARFMKLSKYCTPQRVVQWVHGILKTSAESSRLGMTLPRDNFLSEASEELCRAAALSYEASDAVELQLMTKALGAKVSVREVDLRRVSIEEQTDHFREALVLAPRIKGITWAVAWEDAVYPLREFRSSYPGAVTSVVCEFMSPSEEVDAMCALHLFVPARLAPRADPKDAQSPDAASTPARLLSIPVRISLEMLAALPSLFPHKAWAWLAPELVLSRSNEFIQRIRSDASRTVYSTLRTTSHDGQGRPLRWETLPLHKTDAHPRWRVFGMAENQALPQTVIPNGAVLGIHRSNDPDLHLHSIALFAADELKPARGSTGYLDQCAAQVLAYGICAEIVRMKSEY